MKYIQSESGSGAIAYHSAERSQKNIIDYFIENKDKIEREIYQCGGVLLRDFSIRSLSEFNTLVHLICSNVLDYIYRSTPRTNLGKKIYTATEYPSDKAIVFHNENAYALKWPNKIIFFCVIAPQSGGETPLADSRCVFNKLNKELLDRFNKKKILYKRNYSVGLDLSWQEVFQTADKKIVEQYCDANQMQYHWHDTNKSKIELTTKQICQASIKHPITHENVWFNQAHLFHSSSLNEIDKNFLLSVVNEENLSRNAYYGDENLIAVDDIKHILEAYDSEKIVFRWQKGDVLILDNMLMAHARNAFSGERKIAVAMGD